MSRSLVCVRLFVPASIFETCRYDFRPDWDGGTPTFDLSPVLICVLWGLERGESIPGLRPFVRSSVYLRDCRYDSRPDWDGGPPTFDLSPVLICALRGLERGESIPGLRPFVRFSVYLRDCRYDFRPDWDGGTPTFDLSPVLVCGRRSGQCQSDSMGGNRGRRRDSGKF